MSRPRKLGKRITISVSLSPEHLEWIKKECRHMSLQQKYTVTVSEAIRWAAEKCYPMPKQIEFTNGKKEDNE